MSPGRLSAQNGEKDWENGSTISSPASIPEYTANHFLILFRDTSCQFRAVYTMNPETEEMVRLTGIGPRNITPEMVESIYKYSSDRKQFTVIPSKTMSMSVDAFTIPNHFWQKRPGTPKKLSTPK
ncbi:hypothetical protein GOODEAATRI_019856 [Goodea atripinnis]|uniref:CKK domain-containing protein n=1 Tax=Goodea atripinnis TaxID=208336 RepID=A0ABV0MTJ1_9TELE